MIGHVRRRLFRRRGGIHQIFGTPSSPTSSGSGIDSKFMGIQNVTLYRLPRRYGWASMTMFLFSLCALSIHRAWPRTEDLPAAVFMRTDQKISYLLGYPPCPDPSHPILPVDQTISGRHEACVSVQTAIQDFTVEVCPVSAVCNSFSVKIHRVNQTECERLEALDIPIQNGTRAEWLRWQSGPDSFLLRTSGAQRWASENSVYEGACNSRFDVSLSNGGQVWLELWWIYTVSRLTFGSVSDPMKATFR